MFYYTVLDILLDVVDEKSIKSALAGSFATLLMLSLAQGTVGLMKLDSISDRTAELLDTTIPSINEANDINVLVTRGRLWHFRYAAAKTESIKAETFAKFEEFFMYQNTKTEEFKTFVRKNEKRKIYPDFMAKNELMRPT